MQHETSRVIEGFLQTLKAKGVRAAAEQWVAETYIQHNPKAGLGREGMIAWIEDEQRRGGNPAIKRIVVDGDIAVLHLHMRFSDGTPDLAIMDMFRVEDGKLAEHWDVSQIVPETSLSGNSMF